MIGIFGRKIGMTQIFVNNQYKLIPVSIVLIEDNFVSQLKTKEKDGYFASQLTFSSTRKRNNKSIIGKLKEIDQTFKGNSFGEIRDMTDFGLNKIIDCSLFKEGDIVKLTSISKGKGTSGVIKR
jgi:large subunit ribosomal protein L3